MSPAAIARSLAGDAANALEKTGSEAIIEYVTVHTTAMVPLGYGKFVRADEIVALVPIEELERGDGRRTYVYTETLPEPLIASRSERAILADMERALTAPEAPHRRRLFGRRTSNGSQRLTQPA